MKFHENRPMPASGSLDVFLKKSKHYRDGVKSGLEHIDDNVLCEQNLIKAKLPADTKEIQDYWEGYLYGFSQRGK